MTCFAGNALKCYSCLDIEYSSSNSEVQRQLQNTVTGNDAKCQKSGADFTAVSILFLWPARLYLTNICHVTRTDLSQQWWCWNEKNKFLLDVTLVTITEQKKGDKWSLSVKSYIWKEEFVILTLIVILLRQV